MTDGEAEQPPASTPAPDSAPGQPVIGDAPPDNEFKGRVKAKKVKVQKAKPAKSAADQQIDDAIDASSLKQKGKDRRKLQIRLGIVGAVLAVIGYGVVWLYTPYYGSMAYGICKVFIETNVRYPSYLRISTVEEFESSVRMWYTQIDSFGEYRMEPIQCYFAQDEERGTILEKVLVNRRELPTKLVDDFNRSLSTVIAYPPDLALPNPLPDSLGDLQFQTDLFRKQIF